MLKLFRKFRVSSLSGTGFPFRRNSRAGTNRGYTLVEFLLVILLISIIAGILIPRYAYIHVTKQKVYAVAHDMADDIRYARKLSTGGEPDTAVVYPVVVPQTPTKYWFKLYTLGTATDTYRIFRMNSEANPIKSTSLYGSDVVVTAAATDSFAFNATGTATPAAGGTISVKDAGNNYQWDITVVGPTGRVYLTQIK